MGKEAYDILRRLVVEVMQDLDKGAAQGNLARQIWQRFLEAAISYGIMLPERCFEDEQTVFDEAIFACKVSQPNASSVKGSKWLRLRYAICSSSVMCHMHAKRRIISGSFCFGGLPSFERTVYPVDCQSPSPMAI